ncbi:COX17-domain-containing protein [Schizopora paradoxa]|uniref:COX17-domain-containing protein n=1 Tax=Schizopora paradoxa TaxID=27342 RepID=A0A0H2RTC1_9AGAM|nr:COX17-domain-containing protein [Schizopora paradoxa]
MFERIQGWWNSTSSSSETSVATKETSPKAVTNPLNPQGLKPCCACPETKSARDECFLKNSTGDADEKCHELVQKHLACMRSYGFNI